MNNNLEPHEAFEALQYAEAFGKADLIMADWNGPVYEYHFDVRGSFSWGDTVFEIGEYLVTFKGGRAIAYSGPGEEEE